MYLLYRVQAVVIELESLSYEVSGTLSSLSPLPASEICILTLSEVSANEIELRLYLWAL
jgi:hypothetical protein